MARLSAEVRYQGALRQGADLDLVGPGDSVETMTSTAPVRLTALPGETWLATASYGPCLEGSASRQLVEGDNEVVVDLALTRKAWVSFMVHGADGAPVPGVTVRYQGTWPECLPPASTALDADGTGVAEVGEGRHVIFVEAPEHAIYRQELEITGGQDAVVDVTLAPARTRLEARRIVILDKVYFELDKADIKPESFGLLDEVANVLLANPQIALIEIAGHTDAQGDDAYNFELSDGRANAVREYLVGRGVDGGRLMATGYGEAVPVDTNRTRNGRANNRRVEFNIVRQGAVPEPWEPDDDE